LPVVDAGAASAGEGLAGGGAVDGLEVVALEDLEVDLLALGLEPLAQEPRRPVEHDRAPGAVEDLVGPKGLVVRKDLLEVGVADREARDPDAAAPLLPRVVARTLREEVAERALEVAAEAAPRGCEAFREIVLEHDGGEEVLGKVLGVLVGGGPGAPDQGVDR